MADTSSAAVAYLRTQSIAAASSATNSAAIGYVSIRSLAGLFAGFGASAATRRNRRNLKSWLPSASATWIDKEGRPTPLLYQFMTYVVETILGGPNQHTLPEVERSITYSEAQTLIVNAVTAALQQQVAANAQALSAAVQVVQSAALAGAEQIPPVQLQPADTGGAGGDGGGGGGGGGDGE